MQLAHVRFEAAADVVVATFEGEIDMSNAAELNEAVSRQVANDTRGLVLDLSAVDYLDSAGIHAIFTLRDQLADRGQQLVLVVPPGAVIAEALRVADVPAAVGVRETAGDAIAAIEA